MDPPFLVVQSSNNQRQYYLDKDLNAVTPSFGHVIALLGTSTSQKLAKNCIYNVHWNLGTQRGRLGPGPGIICGTNVSTNWLALTASAVLVHEHDDRTRRI